MGHPGALPVTNEKVVKLSAKTEMALGCPILLHYRFYSKNDCYVDTLKTYRITKYGLPIGVGGSRASFMTIKRSRSRVFSGKKTIP